MRVHLAAVCLLLVGLSTPAFGEDPLDPLWDEEGGISEDLLTDREEVLLDLNTASVEDLASLPPLSRADAERIVTFRKAHGPFRSPGDLSRIRGLSSEAVEALLPRVTVGRQKPSGSLISRARLVRRSSSGQGKPFLVGSHLHSQSTYRLGQRWTAALTTDKDAGELAPLDFVAGFVEVRSAGGDGRLVAGDFRPGFGQGLALGRWSRVWTDLNQIVRRPSRQVGYRSTNENGALRGIYLEGVRGVCKVAVFGSSARFDAVRDAAGQVERLEESGLHVTATERGRADALRESAWGVRMERVAGGRLRAGLTALRLGFSPPFKRQERSGLSGASAAVVGVDGGISLGDLEAAGEVAQAGRGRAWVAGAVLRRGRIRAGLQVRDYDSRFQTPHGAGFSTFGESQNERGIFLGLLRKARRIGLMSLTFDRASRPGPTATLPAGSARSSLTFQVQHGLFSRLLVQWSGRARWDQVWKGKEAGVVRRGRRSLRLDVRRPVGRAVELQGRGEVVGTGIGNITESGGSAFGALRVRWRGIRAEGRLTYFDIPSFESRIFEWEEAPEGMMALRTLTGRGLKGYVMISTRTGICRTTLRLWHQRPLDGRKATTEGVVQMEVGR